MKNIYTVLSVLFLFSIGLNAQDTDLSKPTSVGTVGSMTYVPSINSRLADLPTYTDKKENVKGWKIFTSSGSSRQGSSNTR